MTTMLEYAHYYQSKGFPVYPFAPNTKIPFKGSHGYKDATLNAAKASEWWKASPTANIGISLSGLDIVMLDIDRHENTGVDGFKTLREMISQKRAGELGGTTYAETTPRNGLHILYRLPSGMKLDGKAGTSLFGSGPNEKTGIDFTTTGIPIAPNNGTGGQYKPLESRTIDVIETAPDWLIAELKRATRQDTGFTTNFSKSSPTTKKWFGRLLDEMVNGAASGSRNDFLTYIGGKLFFTGADPETVYNMLVVVNNNFLDEPLKTEELGGVYKSLREREERKWLDAQT